MRVIHFIKNLDKSSGGPSVSVPGLCLALSEIPEMDVHLVTRDSDERVSISESDSLHLHLVDGSRSSVEAVLEPLSLTDDQDGVVFHLHGLWDPMNHHASRFADSGGISTVYSVRGMLEPWALRHKWFKKKLGWLLYQRRDLQRAALLHATARREEESFARCGLGDLRSVILPNGVSFPQDPPVSPGHSRTLLFLGRIHPVKGLVPLLDAWADSAPKGWRLQITGPDEMEHRKELETQIDSSGIEETVAITPPVDGVEKWKLLSSADVFVLPSFTENFGIAAAEALAMGTAVAASTGTPWDWLPREGAGWSVEPTESGWTAFFEELGRTPPETLTELGARGRVYASHHFSWPAIAKRMAEEYHTILQKT